MALDLGNRRSSGCVHLLCKQGISVSHPADAGTRDMRGMTLRSIGQQVTSSAGQCAGDPERRCHAEWITECKMVSHA
jgi:hypothetical protein